MASLSYQKGDYEEAYQLSMKAWTKAQASLGPNHPVVATCLYDLGRIYYRQGRMNKFRF